MLKDFIINLRSNISFRKKIGNVILAILVIILLSILSVKNFTSIGEQPEVKGAKMAVQCPKCNHKEIRRIANIEDAVNNCPKCGTALKQIWKCKKCSFEYPFIKPKLQKGANSSIEEILKLRTEQCKCPNCKSENTYQASIQVLESKKK